MYLRLPRQLHLELTNNCNAKCPMCSRTMNPIDKIDTLSFNVIRNSCENIKFSQINYCGNDGDPLLSQDIGAIINHFAPIPQVIHTNGSLRSKEFWKKLAQTPNLIVVFGIDGATHQSHSKYRIDTNFNKILENAKAFNDAGGTSWWQYIVFEHNQHEIETAKQIAKDYGFKKFEALYSRRNDHENIKTIKIVKNNLQFYCKASEREEIYIRSDGEVFPCVYHGARGNYTGLNIHKTSLKDIVYDVYFDEFNFNNSTCQFNCNGLHKNHRERIDLK